MGFLMEDLELRTHDYIEYNVYLFAKKYCLQLEKELEIIEKKFPIDCRPIFNSLCQKAYERKLLNTGIKINYIKKHICFYDHDKKNVIFSFYNGSIKKIK